MAADALTMKVREGGRVVKIAVMVATGVNADGYREILGVACSSVEADAGWNTFFKDLVARGLNGVALVTSDVHTGLVDAVGLNRAARRMGRRPPLPRPDVLARSRVALITSTTNDKEDTATPGAISA